MAHQPTTLFERVSTHRDALRSLAVLVAVLAAIVLLTALFGVSETGPAYDLVPDPAGALPF